MLDNHLKPVSLIVAEKKKLIAVVCVCNLKHFTFMFYRNSLHSAKASVCFCLCK